MIRSATHKLDYTINRLLIVSDIHGYLEPLVAFNQLFAGMNGHSRIVFNGDLFFGGTRPVETTEWILKNVGELATIGNHDEGMLRGAKGNHPSYTEPGAYQRLNAEQRDYFRTRPHRLELLWRGKHIVLMHGHITMDGKPGSWLASPDQQVANFAATVADVCITSHTHYAFVRQHNGTIVANTGSMSATILGVQQEGKGLHVQSGKPEIGPNEDVRSSFLAVTESDGELHVEIIRFDYDRQTALRDMEQAGQPDMNLYRRWMTDGILNL